MSISGELIVSRYVAESITTDAGCFSHIGLCQLRTKLVYKVDKGLRGRNILHQLLLILLHTVSANDQFALYLYTVTMTKDSLQICQNNEHLLKHFVMAMGFLNCCHGNGLILLPRQWTYTAAIAMGFKQFISC